LACDRLAAKTLRGPVVGTVMSNLGLELALRERNVGFERAKVGDRHVLALLKERGGILGGETSGHVLCLDRTTTGDGIITALQVLSVMQRTGKPLSELVAGMAQLPQVLLNVRLRESADPARDETIRECVRAVEAELGARGRVVLRASGTEPVIRVMVEGEDSQQVRRLADKLADFVRDRFGIRS
jgi:phosphoglucosamine mutase